MATRRRSTTASCLPRLPPRLTLCHHSTLGGRSWLDVVQAAMPSAVLGVPRLDVSTKSDSSLRGFGDSAHMGTFDLVLGEFNTWLADGASTHYTKVFKFLDQKGMEFRKKMYNYRQSKWYGVP
eukprot:1335909-Prymnesium_polylepis.1